jgi:hypothetical protein
MNKADTWTLYCEAWHELYPTSSASITLSPAALDLFAEKVRVLAQRPEERDAIIEECAKVCDSRVAPPGQMTAECYEARRCAQAIRDLKRSTMNRERS